MNAHKERLQPTRPRRTPLARRAHTRLRRTVESGAGWFVTLVSGFAIAAFAALGLGSGADLLVGGLGA